MKKKLLILQLIFVCILSLGDLYAQITIGTQVTQSGATAISPYNYYYESRRVQFVYTQAEIAAAGGVAGTISAIAWDVSQINGGNLVNYTIKMGHTSATDASSHNTASLTTVKNAHTLTPGAVGWRTITFDNDFCWNGTSNILVDVCWGVNPGYGSNGQVWMYNNVASQTRALNLSSSSACGSNTITTRNYKPRVQLTIAPLLLPTATMTKTCAVDYKSYSVSVQVSSLGDFTAVDITDGVTTYQSNVGIGTYTITSLTGNKTIYVKENGGSGDCGVQQSFTDCDICTSPTLPDNECSTATLIDLSQPFAGSTDCAYTPSSGSPSGCGSIENDSWISFIAGSTEVELEYEIGDCAYNDGIQLSVFSGSCGSLSLLSGSCVNPTGELTTGTWNFSGLTIGATYYIRIDGYAGDLCDYWITPLSGVVVTPPNDLCSNAIAMTCGQTYTASNILATATGAPTACGGGGTTAKGVWYSFVGNGSTIVVSTNNAQTNFATNINVYTGSCGTFSCVGGATGALGATLNVATTNGTTYYVYVDGEGTAEGTFEIGITCPSCPANAGTWD
ncbi:MAG: hypothetical protein SFU27_12075 [Thermonemataceae bacterium]|nr:hypothetical protein [Thermonemataceae bacterium]